MKPSCSAAPLFNLPAHTQIPPLTGGICAFRGHRAILGQTRSRERGQNMRLEEMSTDDLRLVAPFCDTVVFAIGGMARRPPHLPTGTPWYILRALRDGLEVALGGRVLTMPVLGFDAQADEGAFFRIPDSVWKSLLKGIVTELEACIRIRYLVLLTDSPDKETLVIEALSEYPEPRPAIIPFLWWRDTNAEGMALPTYTPAGELETSLLLAVAKRLVDTEQKSATRYGAASAGAEQGELYWQHLHRILRTRIEAAWANADKAAETAGADAGNF
jgi:creatinine amidohydrolase/Fe(II)-dependent formamide hydrolase-like protein